MSSSPLPFRSHPSVAPNNSRIDTRETGLAQGNLFEQPGEFFSGEWDWEEVAQSDIEAQVVSLDRQQIEAWLEHLDERFALAVLEHGFQALRGLSRFIREDSTGPPSRADVPEFSTNR